MGAIESLNYFHIDCNANFLNSDLEFETENDGFYFCILSSLPMAVSKCKFFLFEMFAQLRTVSSGIRGACTEQPQFSSYVARRLPLIKVRKLGEASVDCKALLF